MSSGCTVVAKAASNAAAANWKQLGFTISPRGTHSAHMGTGNYTIMLAEDYMELLGVLVATGHNAPTRTYLEQTGGGIERVAFTTLSAAAGAAELRTMGYEAIGPTDFERPVILPDGSKSAAKFATFQWPVAEAPGGVRLFACQHKTRETVWIPELQRHANTARRIAKVFIVTPDVDADARHLAKMIAGEVRGGAKRGTGMGGGAVPEIAGLRLRIGHEAVGDLGHALAGGARLAVAEGAALLGGNEGNGGQARIAGQRHHVHVGPDAALAGKQPVAEEARQVGSGAIIADQGHDGGGVPHLDAQAAMGAGRVGPEDNPVALGHEACQAEPRQPRQVGGEPEHVDGQRLQHR